MECTLCNAKDEDNFIEKGWIPYFYVDDEANEEYENACPSCQEKYLQLGYDDEWELRPEFRSTFKASSSSKMTDCIFDKLKADIEKAMDNLAELQKLHRKQTGVDFVRPLRLG